MIAQIGNHSSAESGKPENSTTFGLWLIWQIGKGEPKNGPNISQKKPSKKRKCSKLLKRSDQLTAERFLTSVANVKKGLDFTEKSVILLTVMRKTTKNIKWFINDLGLNELDAWLAIIGGAALTATILTMLSGNGPEIFRYWRVFLLNL